MLAENSKNQNVIISHHHLVKVTITRVHKKLFTFHKNMFKKRYILKKLECWPVRKGSWKLEVRIKRNKQVSHWKEEGFHRPMIKYILDSGV